jgi:molybdopterin molybdotransferase
VLYFGLPGNPVSALVTFWRFVRPAIAKIAGLKKGWEPKFISAISSGELKSSGKLETYIWGKLDLNNGVYEFRPAFGSHSSGNLINLAQTNALAVLPLGQTFISPQADVLVLLVR